MHCVRGGQIRAYPLPCFSHVVWRCALQLMCLGLVADMCMRTYYESQGRAVYRVRDMCNARSAYLAQLSLEHVLYNTCICTLCAQKSWSMVPLVKCLTQTHDVWF